MVIVATIDPGINHFAICIADIHDGQTDILDLTVENVNTENNKLYGASNLNNDILINITKLLDTKLSLLDKVSIIAIEEQLLDRQVGKFIVKGNRLMKLIENHCISYFLIVYSTLKSVFTIPAMKKTKLLGAPRGLTKYQRKKWAVKKAFELLTKRGDESTQIKICKSPSKKDDMCDCLLMVEVLKLEYI